MKFQHQQRIPTNFSPCKCHLFYTPKITYLQDISSSLRQTFLYFYRLTKNIKTNMIYKFIPNQKSKHFTHTILTYDSELSDLTS